MGAKPALTDTERGANGNASSVERGANGNASSVEQPGLLGAPLLRRTRGLVLWALGAGVLYSSLVGSKGGCPGGFSSDGGYVDGSGNPTEVAPQCVSLTLQPSPAVYLAIVLTVVVALTLAARAPDTRAAMRRLDRGVIAVVGIALLSMAIAIVWFALTPMPTVPGTVWFPFPFGSGTLNVTPMDPGPAG